MLTTHDIPEALRVYRDAEVRATGQAINASELEVAASNCCTFAHALLKDGRIHEAAFWSRMGSKLTEALKDIAAGACARRERVIYEDLLRARLFDLRCAVDNDDNLDGAKPDNATNRNLRRSMTEVR